MTNREAAISTVMIATYAEQNNKTPLDIIAPFVKVAVKCNYLVGDEVDCDIIAKYICEEFCYTNFPTAVVKKIINKLERSEKAFKYGRNNVIIVLKDYNAEMIKFKNNRETQKERINRILVSLKLFLSKRKNNLSTDDNKLLNEFFVYLDNQGFKMYVQNQQIPDSNIETNFLFSTFIKDSDDDIKNDITLIYKGLLVSKTIYYNTDNQVFEKTKKLDCDIYLDSELLLNCLDLKRPAQNENSKELLNSLPSGRIKCFKHTFEEVQGIINGYSNSVKNDNMDGRDIEGFTSRGYTYIQIQEYLSLLDMKIKEIGIEIVDTPKYKNEEIKKYELDENELRKYLIQNMNYSESDDKESRKLNRDIDSIEAITRLRAENKNEILENCSAIFLTTNSNLAYYIDRFTKEQNVHYKTKIVMDDIELTVRLWLKRGNMLSSIFRKRLIENASAIVEEPTQVFMKNLKEMVVNYENLNLTSEQAAIIRTNREFDYEIYSLSNGNTRNCNGEIIKSVLDKHDKNLIDNETKKINEKLQKSENKQIQLQKIIDDKNKKEKDDNTKRIEEKGKIYNFKIYFLYNLPHLIILLASIITFICNLIDKENPLSTAIIIVLIVTFICNIIIFIVNLKNHKTKIEIKVQTYKDKLEMEMNKTNEN